MIQDGWETSSDRFEKGKHVWRFFHQIDSQLGCSICHGLPIWFALRDNLQVNGIVRNFQEVFVSHGNGRNLIQNGGEFFVMREGFSDELSGIKLLKYYIRLDSWSRTVKGLGVGKVEVPGWRSGDDSVGHCVAKLTSLWPSAGLILLLALLCCWQWLFGSRRNFGNFILLLRSGGWWWDKWQLASWHLWHPIPGWHWAREHFDSR